MATKVFMEALSPTMEEGRLVKWLKNEGDAVKNGEPMAEVETDKAIMELVARGDGILRKRLIAEGESQPVGTLIGVIAAADENIDALVAGAGVGRRAAAAKPAEQAAAKPRLPPAAVAGSARSRSASSSSRASRLQPPPPAPSAAGNGGPVRSSPLARRLASDRGLDLAQVRGSGPGGRIIKRDIESAVAARPRCRGGRRSAAARGSRRATSRTSRSRRSERRSPSVSPSPSVRFRPSTSPPNSISRASRRCAPRWPRWATSSRCRSTTS